MPGRGKGRQRRQQNDDHDWHWDSEWQAGLPLVGALEMRVVGRSRALGILVASRTLSFA